MDLLGRYIHPPSHVICKLNEARACDGSFDYRTSAAQILNSLLLLFFANQHEIPWVNLSIPHTWRKIKLWRYGLQWSTFHEGGEPVFGNEAQLRFQEEEAVKVLSVSALPSVSPAFFYVPFREALLAASCPWKVRAGGALPLLAQWLRGPCMTWNE